jgi:hypothetical protein
MQDYANQIAQMFVGYQLTIIDLPRFVEARRGRLEVDLLTDSTILDDQPASPFRSPMPCVPGTGRL